MNRIALNFELPAATEAAPLPDWLMLVPAGRFVGRDGRSWVNDQPAEAIAYNRSLKRDLVVDVEHASEIKAPKGEEAPAAGWIDQLDVRDGAIWGHVDWNGKGSALILNREYRYYSPALRVDAAQRVRGLASVGLTNKHNLELPALNHQQTTEDSMSVAAAIRQALGLKDDANDADAVLAIGDLKNNYQTALNSAQSPSLEKFVPRADHDLVLAKNGELETALNTERAGKRDAEINTLIDQAIADGKITPATREFYVATCNQQGGIEHFKTFIGKASKVTGDDTQLDDKNPNQHQTALNAEQQKVAAMFGNSVEDIAKFGK